MNNWNLEDIEFSMGSSDFACDFRARQLIQKTKNAFKAARIVPRSERMLFIENNIERLYESGQLENIIVHFYTMLHFPVRSYDLETWVNLFDWCNRDRLLAAGDPLPPEVGNKFMVYRGQDIHEELGLSWTLSKSKAEWFVERHKSLLGSNTGDFGVMELEVTAGDIFFYFNEREEQEVVMDPYFITG